MSNQRLIVLTLDSFCPASLGCYGSSWNDTPTMDAIAATGCVWDRLVTSNTDPIATLKPWFQQSRWFEDWKQIGSVEFISDSQAAIAVATKSDFDQLFLIDPVSEITSATEIDSVSEIADAGDIELDDSDDECDLSSPEETDQPNEPASELESTQFAQLIAAAVERISEADDWSVLWLHSDFLSRRWDAPRWLVESEDMEEFEPEPLDDAETLEAEMTRAAEEDADVLEELPEVFYTTTPPCLQIDENTHPDLVATWMRTYGCQVRLVDELIQVLLAAVHQEKVTFVLTGSSGFALGQNGWIGNQQGPLRSCHVHVPLIVGQHGTGQGPIRIPHVCETKELVNAIEKLAQPDGNLIEPIDWGQINHDAFDPCVISRMGTDQRSITTSGWFFVAETDGRQRLYLKPDDVNDFNDVSRLRVDVVDAFVQKMDSETGPDE